MQRRAALFRGINVGKAKRIAMAELKAVFVALDFTGVRTLLNSGNVVYTAKRSTIAVDAQRIALAVAERTGVAANVRVLADDTLDAVVAGNPFTQQVDDASRLLVGFFIDGERAPFEALQGEFPDEDFAIGEHACYLRCPQGINESRIADALANAKFRDRVTARNWSTTLKLQALLRA